jgi:hypothetical protein
MGYAERVEGARRLLGTSEQNQAQAQAQRPVTTDMEYLRSIYNLLSSPRTPPDVKSAIIGSFTTVGGLAMIAGSVDTEGVRGSWLVDYIKEAKVSDEDATRLLKVHLTRARQSLANLSDRERDWLVKLISMVIGGEDKGKAT